MPHDGPVLAVRLLRVGAVPQALLRDLAARVSMVASLPCRVGVAAGVEPVALPGRAQVDADRLLLGLEGLPREPGAVTAGVTDADMGSAIFTHHFGRARHGGRALVISLARLKPEFYGLPQDRGLLLRRASLEFLHELGHVWGLGHCRDNGCIMRFVPTVEGIDNRGTAFCAACASAVALPPALAPR
ncbi:MAG TPA: archaemetzincin [Planctomycetota bacterium]|nr:archaemetzincin [Planctomycetota bacterium]